MSRIMLVDDDEALCRSLALQLKPRGHKLACAHTLAAAPALLERERPELLLIDLHLPDGKGLDLLAMLQQSHPRLPKVMVTGYQDTDAVITAMRGGALDYVRKPFQLEDVILLLEKVEMAARARAATVAAPAEGDQDTEILGSSRAITEVVKQVGLLCGSRVTVLLTGESGTGKELVARALHRASTPTAPFVAVNCSAVAPTLFESEVFGHEKGAFTGAATTRAGKLELAAAGTLFLDEVGDMPLAQQAKLLRVLQERAFEPVGSTRTLPFRARVVAATHQDLPRLVSENRFREDIYYRLAVSTIHIPALRERREDIPLIAAGLVRRIALRLHQPVRGLDREAMELLVAHDWPGNVRELENTLTRAVVLARSEVLTAADLAGPLGTAPVRPPAAGSEAGSPVRPLREAEKEHVLRALRHLGWNITRTARALEVSPTTLRKKIADYGLAR